MGKQLRFNPLPSQEGRPLTSKAFISNNDLFQSTPFARRETTANDMRSRGFRCFNPLPSQEGRPTSYYADYELVYLFQSTPFARRETESLRTEGPAKEAFQSTPFARRETGGERRIYWAK